MIPCHKIALSEPASTHHKTTHRKTTNRKTTHRKIQSYTSSHVKLLIGYQCVEDSFWPMQYHDLCFAPHYYILSPSICGRCITKRIAHMSPHLKNFKGFVLEAFLDDNGRMGERLKVVERKGTKPTGTTFASLTVG